VGEYSSSYIIDLALTHDPTGTTIVYNRNTPYFIPRRALGVMASVYLMFIRGALCRPFYLRAKKVGSIPRPNGGALRCFRRDTERCSSPVELWE
jgi:hypothetical protein